MFLLKNLVTLDPCAHVVTLTIRPISTVSLNSCLPTQAPKHSIAQDDTSFTDLAPCTSKPAKNKNIYIVIAMSGRASVRDERDLSPSCELLGVGSMACWQSSELRDECDAFSCARHLKAPRSWR
jgi:hypothetical protein